MVSAKPLLALYAISGVVHSYPIHRHIEDSSQSHHLTTRVPSPRFRNPFEVDSYLKNLDYEIPNNKDIQEWVKEARKKGALAADGKFSGDNDEDGGDQHNNKATPRVTEDDDDDEDDRDHDHDDQHTAQSAPRPDDEHDDDDDDEDDHEDEAAQPIQSAQPSSPTTHHEFSISTRTPTASAAIASTSSPNHEGDEENNIEVVQPVQTVEPSQPTNAQDSSAPTSAPSSTAPSVDAPNPQPNDKTDDHKDNEDETNQVMQPNNAQDSATPTIPSNTINGGDDAAAAPAVQTVYVPVNVFPTLFPAFPDIDDDEKPSPSSTPLPIFPPPGDITKANLPPAAVPPSTEEGTDTNGPGVSEAPVVEDTPTTPDVTTAPDVDVSPMNEEQASNNTDSTTSTYTPRPQIPSHEAQFSKISELLDMFTPKDESEESY